MIKKIFPHIITSITTAIFLVVSTYLFLNSKNQNSSPLTEENFLALKNKVILITGSSGGIGLALAREAHKHKMKLVLADVLPEKSRVFAQEVRSQGGQAIALEIDLTVESERKRLIEQTIKNFGTIDVLINNAGYLYLAKPEAMELEKVRNVFELHLMASIDLVAQSLPYMKQKRNGHIVNIASILAHYPDISSIGQKGLNSIYTSSKAAVLSWSKVIQNDLKNHNIKVTVVSPAGTKTDFWKNTVGPSQRQALVESRLSWPLYDNPETIAQETFLGFLSEKLIVFPGKAQLIYDLLKNKK